MKARSRIIKPELYQNEDFAKLSKMTRLLFPGLWMLADREGLLKDNSALIKGMLFPYEPANIDKLLTELDKARFIVRYAVQNVAYIWIPKFKKHQKIHPKETQSVIELKEEIVLGFTKGEPLADQFRLTSTSSSTSTSTSTSIVVDGTSNFNTAWDSLKEDKKLEQYSAKGIDLDTEHLKMQNWVDENPAKKNYRRFIINWLNNSLKDVKDQSDGRDKAKEAFLARSEN